MYLLFLLAEGKLILFPDDFPVQVVCHIHDAQNHYA